MHVDGSLQVPIREEGSCYVGFQHPTRIRHEEKDEPEAPSVFAGQRPMSLVGDTGFESVKASTPLARWALVSRRAGWRAGSR